MQRVKEQIFSPSSIVSQSALTSSFLSVIFIYIFSSVRSVEKIKRQSELFNSALVCVVFFRQNRATCIRVWLCVDWISTNLVDEIRFFVSYLFKIIFVALHYILPTTVFHSFFWIRQTCARTRVIKIRFCYLQLLPSRDDARTLASATMLNHFHCILIYNVNHIFVM